MPAFRRYDINPQLLAGWWKTGGSAHYDDPVRTVFAAILFCATAAAQQTIDFSYAGYGGSGGAAIPPVPGVLTVHPTGRDDTALLQSAIDAIAAMPLQGNGYRGALLLGGGRYRLNGQLHVRASGIVISRGREPVILTALGTSRRTLIEIGGAGDPATDAGVQVTDDTVPAGGSTLTLESLTLLKAGDRVVVTRPSTAEWIADLGMRGLPGNYANQRLDWAPGSRNLVWDRTVLSVDAARRQITLDAPITTALEKRYGGGTVACVKANPPIQHVGIEGLVLESDFDQGNPRDEAHSWTAISLDHVEDAFVFGVAARYFAGSAVRVGPRARRISILRSRSEEPVSEPAGYRRQSFLVEGQQVLVRECTSDSGMNDFATGLLAAGPNVFLESKATHPLGASGSFESWASGVLYEDVTVKDGRIQLTKDSSRAQGAGWTAANSLISNCTAKEREAAGPPGAENQVQTRAESLYAKQYEARFKTALPPIAPLEFPDAARVKEWPAPAVAKTTGIPRHPQPVTIVGGRFVANRATLWGGQVNEGWWRGHEVPASALQVGGVSITRWMPGRIGPGLTEDLEELARKMTGDGTPFYQSIPGLWYDRRRDEHSTEPRSDADVWAPFYEMPWARSGEGKASDGLSKFDLRRFNDWYYERLRTFGQMCDEHGLVFYHNIYNTHNLLEILPHWVDYPWRPANNIEQTGLPEPPPVEPGNHIHVANQVYDVSNRVRRSLHYALIMHELEELGPSKVGNIFFSLGAQFSGPLEFQEFFQDTVAEWEKRTGLKVKIMLATSKDITDAILANPERARQVAVIDMRYWQYKKDGTLWAPKGGEDLAFREMIGRDFGRAGDQPPDTTPYQVYRQVREYHDKYPNIAIVAWNGGAGPVPVLMAGGAQALMRNPSAGQGQGTTVDRTPLDGFVRQNLAGVLMNMQPRDGVASDPQQEWCLADDGFTSVLLYSLAGEAIHLAKPLTGAYRGTWFDPRTGETRAMEGAMGTSIPKPGPDAWLLWLRH